MLGVCRLFSIVTFACLLYNATVKGVWNWVIFGYKSPHWLINGMVMFIGIIVIVSMLMYCWTYSVMVMVMFGVLYLGRLL